MSSFDGAKAMVDQAVSSFGDLHVVVNNAGILRDRMLVSSERAGVRRCHRGPPEGHVQPHQARGGRLAGRSSAMRQKGLLTMRVP